MNRRSLFIASFCSLAILAPLGCSAPTASEDGSEDSVAESQDLTAAASKLVGNYYTHTVAKGGFARLELSANGKYTASLDPDGKIVCVTSPCLLPESGRWNASAKRGGGYRLRIRPSGDASRLYDAHKTAGSLDLSRAGTTETLTALGPKAGTFCGGFANIACGANEECVDDPNDGCDPAQGGADCGGICQPKSPPPPPPPACFGAWLDQLGTCRTPSDGVYPASCCAGMTTDCGPAKCGVGTSCCNGLAGICAVPDMACTQ